MDGLGAEPQFPFIRVSTLIRMYYVPDVLNWLLANRKVLNQGAGLPRNGPSGPPETGD